MMTLSAYAESLAPATRRQILADNETWETTGVIPEGSPLTAPLAAFVKEYMGETVDPVPLRKTFVHEAALAELRCMDEYAARLREDLEEYDAQFGDDPIAKKHDMGAALRHDSSKALWKPWSMASRRLGHEVLAAFPRKDGGFLFEKATVQPGEPGENGLIALLFDGDTLITPPAYWADLEDFRNWHPWEPSPRLYPGQHALGKFRLYRGEEEVIQSIYVTKDASGNPGYTLPDGEEYNVTVDLVEWHLVIPPKP